MKKLRIMSMRKIKLMVLSMIWLARVESLST